MIRADVSLEIRFTFTPKAERIPRLAGRSRSGWTSDSQN